MKFPPFIRQGDTLGFVAPSFGCAIEPYRCLLYTSPSPRDPKTSRMPSSA